MTYLQEYDIIKSIANSTLKERFVMPKGMSIFSAIVYIFYIIIFASGLVNAIAPKWFWKTFESWKATKEPTKTYFITKRISGIIIMIVIAVIALAPIFIAYFDK